MCQWLQMRRTGRLWGTSKPWSVSPSFFPPSFHCSSLFLTVSICQHLLVVFWFDCKYLKCLFLNCFPVMIHLYGQIKVVWMGATSVSAKLVIEPFNLWRAVTYDSLTKVDYWVLRHCAPPGLGMSIHTSTLYTCWLSCYFPLLIRPPVFQPLCSSFLKPRLDLTHVGTTLVLYPCVCYYAVTIHVNLYNSTWVFMFLDSCFFFFFMFEP